MNEDIKLAIIMILIEFNHTVDQLLLKPNRSFSTSHLYLYKLNQFNKIVAALNITKLTFIQQTKFLIKLK